MVKNNLSFKIMIKKFVGIILFIFFICQGAFAQTIIVKAMEDFSTENPSETFSVQALESLYLNDATILFKGGDIITGKITDVKNPKRLKRDAKFSFLPISVKTSDGIIKDVEASYPAKYTTLLNKGELARKAALGVGNYFVKGLSLGYSAVEGAVKNEKDNRFKSSMNSVYEDSPFSLVRKGDDINIKKGQAFLLNFKITDCEDDEPQSSVD